MGSRSGLAFGHRAGELPQLRAQPGTPSPALAPRLGTGYDSGHAPLRTHTRHGFAQQGPKKQ